MRKFLLFAAIAGIVAFLALDQPPKRSGTGNAAAPEGSPGRASSEALQLPDRGGLSRSRGELFGAPPQPKAAPAAPVLVQAPVAPPLPYRFAGKVRKGGEEEVLVTKGDIVFSIKVGDTLDGTYRVESIGPDRIELLYLPLGTREHIAVSSALETDSPVAAAPAQSVQAQIKDISPAQLRWEGPERVQAGTSFSVALRVNTKEALRAAPMQLRFEPGVLEAVEVRPGKFFGDGNFSYRVNPEGSIFVGATSPAAVPGSDAELVVVTFKPIKRGATAELTMGVLSLQGTAGRAIAHERPSVFRTAIQ